MKLRNFTQEEAKHILTLYAGAALTGVIIGFKPEPALIAKTAIDFAEALLKELDKRITDDKRNW